MVSVAVNPPPPSSTRGLAHYARAHSISPYGCERVSLVYFRIFRAAGFSEYAGKRGTKVAPGSCLKSRREHTCSGGGGGAFVRKLGRIRRPATRSSHWATSRELDDCTR